MDRRTANPPREDILMGTLTGSAPNFRRLWIILFFVIVGSFLVLLGGGREIYQHAPPIPTSVVSESGKVLFDKATILKGQSVWRRMGGQHVGSIWGHGAYQAPDWSGEWLHKEAVFLLDLWAQRDAGVLYNDLALEPKAGLKARLVSRMRTNTYQTKTETITLSQDRAQAFEVVSQHYLSLFGADPKTHSLRESYALPENLVPVQADREALSSFFWWTAWACGTNRPGLQVTYTNNWPHEPLIQNVPSADVTFWSVLSFVFLLAGIGALSWFMAANPAPEAPPAPKEDPLKNLLLTPSMKATRFYFLIAIALFALQVLMGVFTVHYTVEGQAFFGFPLAEYLPYPLTRTWHIQLGLFWIATSFLATGLFIAPTIGGEEPKGQRAGVLVLLGALVLVVLGSLTGEYLAIQGHLANDINFWVGHQGFEYVELGRVWQIALFGGLLLWHVLMVRGILPALKRTVPGQDLTKLLALSVVAIGTLYGVGLMWGPDTNLAVAEYWRWWVVHLWVEGFFEVFATAVMAFFFCQLGLLDKTRAAAACLFSTSIFLGGGIIGTFHHLYFSGTPVGIMALGASFSAMEVVPLVLIGFEAMENYKHMHSEPWVARYKWPIRFFMGVSFWNFVGAGLFGFLINPPIALYYMQGMNTTPVHAHTALFGVYGLLSIGMILLCLRLMSDDETWSDGAIKWCFWGTNIGLAAMIVFSLLPVGLLQTFASMEHGMWYARSAEFLQQPLIENLRWARMPGDGLFILGTMALARFAIRIRPKKDN